MRRWAHWLNDVTGSGSALPSQASGMPQAGFYQGKKENILRQKQHTARGKQSPDRSPFKQFCPEGYDTELAIDKAIRSLRKTHARAAAVVEELYLHHADVVIDYHLRRSQGFDVDVFLNQVKR